MAAILRQECAWFDQLNYTELTTKLTRECAVIEKGLSEKAGTVTNALATFISGMAVGFYMGWELALALLVLVPVIGVIGAVFSSQMTGGIKKALISYSQSAGYAEQAMSAIRVVAAFGMEKIEFINYSTYLQQTKLRSIRNHFINSASIALMIFFIYLSYGYAFWVGSIFVSNQV